MADATIARSDPKAFRRAREELLKRIVNGDFAPNTHLTETGLSGLLEVSRTTVRAVLLDLNKEGYVVLEHNRGARVRAFTPEESVDILQVRERLEGMAAGLAAERASSEELATLDAIIAEMTVAAANQDSAGYSSLNRRFHAQVLSMARNETLAHMLEQTRYQLVMRQFRNEARVHPRDGSLEEHRAIVVAIRARDAVAAERMMRLHVSSARAALDLKL